MVWIFIGVALFVLLLIAIILLLPISCIIKTDQNGKLVFLCKILFKTFTPKKQKPNSKTANVFKKAIGIDRLDFKTIKESTKKGELLKTIRQDFLVITDLLAQLVGALKTCTVKTLKLNIVCAEEDAAQTAITYGVCNALVSSFLAFVYNNMNVRKKGEEININVNFQKKENSFGFEIVLVFRIYNLLFALLKIIKDEAKRKKSEF